MIFNLFLQNFTGWQGKSKAVFREKQKIVGKEKKNKITGKAKRKYTGTTKGTDETKKFRRRKAWENLFFRSDT